MQIIKMKKQYKLICYLLIMLIYTSYQSPDDCSDLDNDNCDQYIPPNGDDGTKQCLPVGENGKCALKSCDELSHSDCNKYNPIGSGADIQNCVGKSNIINGQPECELKKCNEMNEDYCYTFETKSNEYQCLDIYDETTEERKCSYVTCSDLTNSCNFFHFEDEEYQCVETKNGNGCEKKKCTELEGDRCYAFRNDDGIHVCISNEREDRCEYKTCSQLEPNKCSHYALYDEQNRACLETDDKTGCEYKKCEDLSPPFCYKFTPRYAGFNCIEDNGKCVERQCSDYNPPNCGNFELKDEGFICDVDPNNRNSCIERNKKCEEYSYLFCNNFSWNNYNSDGELERCMQKEDKTGCELKSCANTDINQCGKYIPMNSGEKCALNAAGNKCEIQKCSGQNANSCNSFIPNDKSKKCVNVDDHCEIKIKQCSEFSVDECYLYDIDSLEEDEDNPNSCIPKANNEGCELKHCGDLNPNECSKFKPIYEDELQCISRGSGCQLVPCTKLTNTECSNFISTNLEYNCIPKGTGCVEKIKECSELPISFCKNTYYYENGDQCILNNDGTRCMIKGKGGSNDPINSSNSKKEKESENSSNIIKCFILKFLLFLSIF